MKSFGTYACAVLLATGFAAPAFAAGADPAAAPAATAGSNQNPANAGATNASANPHIAQQVRADLGKAGYTDIQIMPSSFLVRAKDSQGNPVMMVINPDSVTSVTEENMGAASNANHGATSGSPANGAPAKTNP